MAEFVTTNTTNNVAVNVPMVSFEMTYGELKVPYEVSETWLETIKIPVRMSDAEKPKHVFGLATQDPDALLATDNHLANDVLAEIVKMNHERKAERVAVTVSNVSEFDPDTFVASYLISVKEEKYKLVHSLQEVRAAITKIDAHIKKHHEVKVKILPYDATASSMEREFALEDELNVMHKVISITDTGKEYIIAYIPLNWREEKVLRLRADDEDEEE